MELPEVRFSNCRKYDFHTSSSSIAKAPHKGLSHTADWVCQVNDVVHCEFFCSKANIENNQVKKLTSILRKENVVNRYKAEGHKVVFIGDGNNDVEAMRCADIAIASGLTHEPAMSVLSVADYLIYDEETLCRQLNQLL